MARSFSTLGVLLVFRCKSGRHLRGPTSPAETGHSGGGQAEQGQAGRFGDDGGIERRSVDPRREVVELRPEGQRVAAGASSDRTVTVVPEPTSSVLFGLTTVGVCVGIGRRRQRRKASSDHSVAA